MNPAELGVISPTLAFPFNMDEELVRLHDLIESGDAEKARWAMAQVAGIIMMCAPVVTTYQITEELK
jgi:hypothetical protein